MIYGINFNGVPIPPGVKRLFADTKPLHRCSNERDHQPLTTDGMKTCRVCGGFLIPERGRRAHLIGVAQSESEKEAMLIQASNGHRVLHVVTRHTAAAPWFGIYEGS